MPTSITTRAPNQQPKQYRVKEGVGKVANEVNHALASDHKFVVVTGEDDKKFTLTAKLVVSVKAVD